MTDDAHDRRRYPRLKQIERLLIQSRPTGPGEAQEQRITISSKTRDVSRNGLCFRSNEPFPSAAKVDLWVEIRDLQKKFFLSGSVKWTCLCEDGDGFWHGIEFDEGPDSDLELWRNLFDFAESGTEDVP